MRHGPGLTRRKGKRRGGGGIPVPIGRCEHSGKLCYAGKRAAKRVRDLMTRPIESRRGSVYRCDHCGSWHVTSWAPRTYKYRKRKGGR